MFVIQEAASFRLDQIYCYIRDKGGDKQAESYISGLFTAFHNIVTQNIVSRPIPAEFCVEGYFCPYEHHYIYWKRLENGTIGIGTVLHDRMHQISRFKDDFTIG